ncbi:MAG: hypothetical protein HOI23_18740 [Deltaproteobacteria bacterium]|nr:hypothetical protein [Deltaproteobacteria bacterium]
MKHWSLPLILILSLNAAPAPASDKAATRLIVVTVDGLRWQELFTGIDPKLKSMREAGMKRDADHKLAKRLSAPSPEARRKLLFPYFWGKLAQQGVLAGNRNQNSFVNVTNQVQKSYSGYAEILTGQALDKEITSNLKKPMPAQTLLEAFQDHGDLKYSEVALFASWERFQSIAAKDPSRFVINAGFQEFSGPGTNARTKELSRRQFEQLTPWTEVRHDYITCELALNYLRTQKPKALYLGLGETDDWAHDKRYARVLWASTYFDTCLEELVNFIDSDEAYRGQTLLVITTDHGRGRTSSDWHHHKLAVPGSDEIWLYLRGPSIPKLGELSGSAPIKQTDIAPTVLQYLGISANRLPGMTGEPISWTEPSKN